MGDRQDTQWLKAIGNKLREDLGDCPTPPDDMRKFLDRQQAGCEADQQREPRRVVSGPSPAAMTLNPRAITKFALP
jgi:hypothetical protein